MRSTCPSRRHDGAEAGSRNFSARLPKTGISGGQKNIREDKRAYRAYVEVAKLVDALALGASGATHGGSNPLLDTIVGRHEDYIETIVDFNNKIVEATKDLVCAYKPNIAFYEAHGAEGIRALRHTIENIHLMAPNVLVILDAKRADIGNTNNGYVEMAFGYLGVDAITVHPYLGGEALQPFLDYKDKGIFVLCRTSNPGAGEFQDIQIQNQFLYQIVAEHVTQKWNTNGNCGLVVGATYPDELREIRRIAPDMPILIPGIGAQGGDLEKTVRAGKDSRRKGMIINSSRGIIFASKGADFAEAARRETEKLRNAINDYR